MSDYFVYVFVGGILIYLAQRFPPAEWLANKLKLEKLYECDLCLGVWVYFFLAFPLKINIIEQTYIVVISEFLTGAVTSFVVWLIKKGWKNQFGEYKLD